jgi:hypothetical protein
MAKAKQQAKKKVDWKGYHSCNLLTADELPYENWAATQVIQLSDLDVIVQAGYKFSLNWDAFHSGVSASLYASDGRLDWAGYSLTAWASDAESAIKLLFYKHYVMCEEQWEIAPNNTEKSHRTYG